MSLGIPFVKECNCSLLYQSGRLKSCPSCGSLEFTVSYWSSVFLADVHVDVGFRISNEQREGAVMLTNKVISTYLERVLL